MFKIGKKLSVVLAFLLMFNFNVSLAKAEDLGTSTAAVSFTRVGGNDRIETSIDISKLNWTKNSDEVIIAYAYDFPDSLCAVPLAKMYKAPILLCDKDNLDADMVNEIKRLSPKRITIIGGDGAISDTIKNQLSSIASVERIGGRDRYETSVLIAQKLSNVTKVVVATGHDFPDALSAASIAGMKGMPILLSDKDSVPDVVSQYIAKKNINSAYIVGGVGVLSENIDKHFSNSTRLAGSNRYETNMKILEAFKSDLDLSKVYFATADGNNSFADALAGADVAALNSAPLILTGQSISQAAIDFISKNIESGAKVVVFGGTGAVSDSVIDRVVSVINSSKDNGNKDNSTGGNNASSNNNGNNKSKDDDDDREPSDLKISVPQQPINGKNIIINSVTVTGNTVTINGNSTDNQVVVKVLRPNKSILFLDVPTMNSGSFSTTLSFDKNFESGDYMTVIGQNSDIVNFNISISK